MNPRALLLALTLLCGACSHTGSAPTTATPAAPLRLATYNTSLNSDKDDGLIAALQGDSAQARKIAAVLQQVRPDLVLLNEFDYDDAHRAADLFQQRRGFTFARVQEFFGLCRLSGVTRRAKDVPHEPGCRLLAENPDTSRR